MLILTVFDKLSMVYVYAYCLLDVYGKRWGLGDGGWTCLEQEGESRHVEAHFQRSMGRWTVLPICPLSTTKTTPYTHINTFSQRIDRTTHATSPREDDIYTSFDD